MNPFLVVLLIFCAVGILLLAFEILLAILESKRQPQIVILTLCTLFFVLIAMMQNSQAQQLPKELL